MSENQTTTSWGSRLGFILASAGSAVGLGAIWKFPYMAGTNGGSVFMLPYIFFTFTVGISLLVAEFAMGRAGREGPMASLTKVCGRGWGFFGGVGVFTVFLILSFYSGVGGWCIKYMVDAVIGRGLISDSELLGTHFGAFVSDGSMSFLYMMIFLGITSVVVLRGIQGGIERVAKVLMPALFILMLIIIVRGLTLPGGLAGLEYLFAPRWEDFNASALFNAMGFCFFSLSLGAGTMITYGSYLSPKADLPGAVGWVAVLAIMSSILGGLMVLPAVFAFGLDPSAGPGLTFVTMPAVFSKMPLGQLFAVMFYVCLVVAALTSSVSMLEACTALLTRQFNMRRTPAILLTVASCTVVGLASTLSFGVWSDVKFFNRTIFDILDYVQRRHAALNLRHRHRCRLGGMAHDEARAHGRPPRLRVRPLVHPHHDRRRQPALRACRRRRQPLMTEDSARRLVYAVLAQEYRAHRSLWIGTLCLALGAAMFSGRVVDGASSLRNAASIVIVLGALYLMVLLVLRQELSARSAGLPPDEAIAFRKGLTSGLLRACAPAVLAIIVCSTALLVL